VGTTLASPGSDYSLVPVRKTAPDECRALIEQLQASQTLQRSPRLRELLAYLATATLEENVAGLKETAIGCAVYGRPAGYNTNDDNVVRMGVSQLRRKLAEYFASEGKTDPIQVDIPKGQYALVFRLTVAESAESSSVGVSLPEFRPMAGRRRLLAIIITAVLFVGAISFGAGWAARRTSKAAVLPAQAPFWEAAIGDGAATLFVSEDVDFLATVSASHQTPSLEAYADGRESALGASGAVRHSPVPATTQLSLRIATRLAAHQPERFGRVRFVPSREMRLQDFKDKNVILVGSPRACPWLSLFENTLNFQFEHDPVRHVSAFRNRSPQPGEPASYQATASNAVGGKVYSSVALLPNLTRTGRVLILMGARTEGTAAAGEAVTTPRILETILQAVGYSGSGPLPYFEALLESRVIGNSSAAPNVVAVRRYAPDRTTLAAVYR